MPTCSSCKTTIVETPASGICPECGHLLGSPSRKTEVHLAATMELGEPGEQPANPRANPPALAVGKRARVAVDQAATRRPRWPCRPIVRLWIVCGQAATRLRP